MAPPRIDMAQLAVVFHDLDQARAAARVARAARARLVLHSAPGAVHVLGPMMFREMLDALRREFPRLPVTGILDCGEAVGRALGAIRCGVDAVRVEAGPDVRARLEAIAEAYAVRVATEPLPDLDLAVAADPEAACRDALGPGTRAVS